MLSQSDGYYLGDVELVNSHEGVDWSQQPVTENDSASVVSRLSASYEAARDLKTEKKIAEVIDK